MKTLNPEIIAHNIAAAFVEEHIRNCPISLSNAKSKNSLIISVHEATELYMLAYAESYKHIDSANKANQSFDLEI